MEEESGSEHVHSSGLSALNIPAIHKRSKVCHSLLFEIHMPRPGGIQYQLRRRVDL